MILGLGSDLVDVRRIEKTIARFGARFMKRCFTCEERQAADERPRPANTYAKRFAAKEAVAKALGTGFAEGISWQQIGVRNVGSGKPIVELSGNAADRLGELVPYGMVGRIDLSLADEPPHAYAIALISAVPASAVTGT